MNNNSISVLRDQWEQFSTEQLDKLLHCELMQEPPEGERVRLILDILQQRESDTAPDIPFQAQKAWQRYQARVTSARSHTIVLGNWMWKAASVVLVLLVLTAFVPQETTAANFFQRIIAWTEDVFSLKSPNVIQSREMSYEFQTDNPGLQEIYDQVTSMGVTTPVVPMWLPEGYALVESEVENTPIGSFLTATFFDGVSEIIYQLDIYSDNITSAYYKDENVPREKEANGVTYSIIQNKDQLVAVWIIDNIECFIVIDCQEDILDKILKSIYTMED